MRRFVRKIRVNYPVALGSKATKLLFEPGETLPITVVIDRDGNVREVIEGILFPEEFEEKIKPLLFGTDVPLGRYQQPQAVAGCMSETVR